MKRKGMLIVTFRVKKVDLVNLSGWSALKGPTAGEGEGLS